MGKFNLNEYDQVDSRIKKFYEEHKEGRILTEVLFQDGMRTLIKAIVYVDDRDIPKATGHAEEVRTMEKAISKKGTEYEEVNYTSWTENAETSAIGRALANMGYSGSKRPSREEMEKVQRYTGSYNSGMASDKQKSYIKSLKADITDEELSKFTSAQASKYIEKL